MVQVHIICVICNLKKLIKNYDPSANEWIQKLWYIYTMEFYAAERKKKLIPFANSMDATGEHYAK